jgi:streptomycin 6-kinase
VGLERLEQLAAEWGVRLTDRFETASSLIAYGRRGDQPVVMKIMLRQGDEWHAGEVVEAFDGAGVVRAYAHTPGATLLERIMPGDNLVALVTTGRDDEATDLLAEVIVRMRPKQAPRWVPSVADWGRGFERYAASGDRQIPATLVSQAREIFMALCASQKNQRLLHGDLHHYNVLRDNRRGWLAIDPKGVIGEIEYEIGAALRNPHESTEHLADRSVVERRVHRFSERLGLNPRRILEWAFSQAVLSAIWCIEDGDAVDATNPSLVLAGTIGVLLTGA